jgi:hypothetical protein
MTGSKMDERIFSGFSFNLLLDSGWYKINTKYIENF